MGEGITIKKQNYGKFVIFEINGVLNLQLL